MLIGQLHGMIGIDARTNDRWQIWCERPKQRPWSGCLEDSEAVVVLLLVMTRQRGCARDDYGHDGGCRGEEGQATLNGNGAKHTISGLSRTPRPGWPAILCTTVVGLDVAFWSTMGLQTASHDR